MQTLYHRLTSEALIKLQSEAEKYPNAIKAIMLELDTTTCVLDLKYGTVLSMSNFLGLRDYTITQILNQFEQ